MRGRTYTLTEFVDRFFGGNTSAFAAWLEVSQSSARRWLLEPDDPMHLYPSAENVLAIYVKTGGRVPPNKLYPLPPANRRPLPILPRSKMGRPVHANGRS